MMTADPNFERLKTTLLGGQADRVPLAEITIDEGMKEAFLGRKVNDLSEDVEFYVKAGYDYMTLGRRIAGFEPIWSAARLENYYEVQRKHGLGTSKGIINSWNDLKNYTWIKPGELDFRILDHAANELPENMKVIRYIGPIFQLTWMLMGFDAFSYCYVDDPGLIEAMIDKISDVVFCELDDALQRDIVGAIWYADDIAIKDRLMVSPEFLRKNLFPRLKFIADKCHEKSLPLIYHSDGDISEVLDEVIECGVDALHPIDPLGMDIYRIKKRVAGRLCIIGNIDVALLTAGTVEQVVEETKKHLELLGPGGGYVLGSGNSIPRTCKVENYKAMLETTMEYGRY